MPLQEEKKYANNIHVYSDKFFLCALLNLYRSDDSFFEQQLRLKLRIYTVTSLMISAFLMKSS